MPGAHPVVDKGEQPAGHGDLPVVVARLTPHELGCERVEELLEPKLPNTPNLDPPSSPEANQRSTPATYRRTGEGHWSRRSRSLAHLDQTDQAVGGERHRAVSALWERVFETNGMGDNDRWTSGRGILNGAGARRPEHSLWPHVPILARVVWADIGQEEWLETVAMGWTGDLVYVDMRRSDYTVNACWLDAADVKRM